VRLALVEASRLGLDVRALGLLRRRGASILRLLWLLRLRVYLAALLVLLLVRVLGVDGRLLLGNVRGLGVLVHGNFIAR
jgi:hypothetical protein